MGHEDKLGERLVKLKHDLESAGLKLRDMSTEIKSIGLVGGIRPRHWGHGSTNRRLSSVGS